MEPHEGVPHGCMWTVFSLMTLTDAVSRQKLDTKLQMLQQSDRFGKTQLWNGAPNLPAGCCLDKKNHIKEVEKSYVVHRFREFDH